MATEFDDPPVYDALTKNDNDYMSDGWILWISTFFQTLSEYLSQYGVFIPNLTTEQRNTIQSPQEGQLIYNTDRIPGPPRVAVLQVWQVKLDVGAWRDITTTP